MLFSDTTPSNLTQSSDRVRPWCEPSPSEVQITACTRTAQGETEWPGVLLRIKGKAETMRQPAATDSVRTCTAYESRGIGQQYWSLYGTYSAF